MSGLPIATDQQHPPVTYSVYTGQYFCQGRPICGSVPCELGQQRIPSIAEFLTMTPRTAFEQHLYDEVKKHNKPP